MDCTSESATRIQVAMLAKNPSTVDLNRLGHKESTVFRMCSLYHQTNVIGRAVVVSSRAGYIIHMDPQSLGLLSETI